MAFLIRSAKTARPTDDPHASALDEWRTAAQLVSERWDAYRSAGPEGGATAYRAYLAALDAEEAAAGELAGLTLRPAV
jgi:hypothetical protein